MRQDEYFEESRLSKRDNIGFNILPPNAITYRSRSDNDLYFFNENKLGITGIVSVYYPIFQITDGICCFFLKLFERYSQEIGTHGVGNAQKVLSLNALKKIRLPIPRKPEQEKISDCLQSLDDKLDWQLRHVNCLEGFKNGLLQGFFPTTEELYQ